MARGAFHHALIIPATFLNKHPKADNTRVKIRREALNNSEDLARHMANYVMNQIPTLSVTHISSSDTIASDIWSDPFRVYACLFAKASRVLFLVTHHDVTAFNEFTKGHLLPLLNQSTAKNYNWKSRFLVLAMGDFELPASLPCEVIRFREVAWFRDSMALFVLGKKIQEFWTPNEETSRIVATAEKLKYVTSLEETETFQTSLIVKNLIDEDFIENPESIQGNFDTKFNHEGAVILNKGPTYITRQNFNVRFDIESNRSLELHELLLSNLSLSGLGSITQTLQTNAPYYIVQSDVGFTGSFSDMDDISPSPDDAHSTNDSVAEMRWSSPDSVSVVRETEVNSIPSHTEGELTLVTVEADGLASKPPRTNGIKKALVAEGNAEITLGSEPPKPTKRTRTSDNQIVSPWFHLSSARKQHTFSTHKKNTLIVLSGEEIHSPIVVEASTETPLKAINEHLVESGASVRSIRSCDFVQQPKLGAQKSEGLLHFAEPETILTASKRTSPSEYFKIAKANATASFKLSDDQKCTSLAESQCFGEQNELLSDIRPTETLLALAKSPTLSSSLLQLNSEVSSDWDKERDQEEKHNSRPRNHMSDKMTSDYNLVISTVDLSRQTSPIKSDGESPYSKKKEPLVSGRPADGYRNKCIELRTSRPSNTYGKDYGDLQCSPNSTAERFKVEKKRKTCNFSPNTRSPPPKSQSTRKKGVYGQENIHGKRHNASSVQRNLIPKLTDSRTDKVTTITDFGDEYSGDACIEQMKQRLIGPRKKNSRVFRYNKRRSYSFEHREPFSQQTVENCLSNKSSASEPHLNLSINSNTTKNKVPNPYVVSSTMSDQQADEDSIINANRSFKSSIEPTILDHLQTFYSAIVNTSQSPAVSNMEGENELSGPNPEGAVDLKTGKTTLTKSDFPSVSKKCASLQVEELFPISNSIIADDDKSTGDCVDVLNARSEAHGIGNVASPISRSVPKNDVLKEAKERNREIPSQIPLRHNGVIKNEVGGRQNSVQRSSQRVKLINIFKNEADFNTARRTCSAIKSMKHDPDGETCSDSSKNQDVKSAKSDASHFGKSPRTLYFKDNPRKSASNKLGEHATSHSVNVRDATANDGKDNIDDYPAKDLAKHTPPSMVYRTHEHINAAIPLYSPASKSQSMLAIREPSLWQTTDVVEHGSWKNDKTQNIDVPKEIILSKQSEFQDQKSERIMQLDIKTMEDRSESSCVLTHPKAYNGSSKGQNSSAKKVINSTTNYVSSKGTSYTSKWIYQDSSISSLKCPSPLPDSDCDPEITSSTMSRPSCLLSSDKFLSSHALSKIQPRAEMAQTDYLKLSTLGGYLKNDNQNNVSSPCYCLDSGVETVQPEVMKRLSRSGELESEIEKRFSSVSINDEVSQQGIEVADTSVGPSYSKLGVLRPPEASSVQLFHETGEYKRNLSTQVQSCGRRHEIEVHGPYFRLIQEKFKNNEGPSTYWCDRSVGSPTPYECSIGSDIALDSPMTSETSRISSKDAKFTINSRKKTVKALVSVYKALGKASKLLSSSNETIMKQIELLNSEER
ncbi:expressed protein [Echinococcus multilocularis]|uniref:Expressed protein n=1 Tax=Echinococcus multilocularis TaxID=6211 RepID=A0A068YDZ0_ECHMU|nr:expressed protein [Echinococcus multilocularis]